MDSTETTTNHKDLDWKQRQKLPLATIWIVRHYWASDTRPTAQNYFIKWNSECKTTKIQNYVWRVCGSGLEAVNGFVAEFWKEWEWKIKSYSISKGTFKWTEGFEAKVATGDRL